MENRTIRVLFLRSDIHDHWMNRLVASFDPPFCHVEIDFDMSHTLARSRVLDLSFISDNSRAAQSKSQSLSTSTPISTSMASSIYSGEKLFFKQRRFASPNYTVVTLTVDTKSFNRMLKYCQEKKLEPFSGGSQSILNQAQA